MEKFVIKSLCLFTVVILDVSTRDIRNEVWEDVRLADGGLVYQGRVEVKVNGTWGTVCDDSWSTFDGVVVCRQLGFDGLLNIRPGGYFGPGSGPIWHDDLQCTSRESSLSECRGLHDPNRTDCSHAEDAGVICFPPRSMPTVPICRDNQYLCVSERKCIPARWVCDSQKDCHGSEDEYRMMCNKYRNCGRQFVRPVSTRVVGGHPARPGTWPWMANIKVVFPRGTLQAEHICGGSLVAPQWVLSAAHCFEGWQNWTSLRVVVGDTDTNRTEGTEQEFHIQTIVIHQNYTHGGHANDIAMVKLQSPVDLSRPNVSVACLPLFGDRPYNSSDTCYVTGWGDTKGTGSSSVLRHAQVPILSNTLCSGWYGSNSTIQVDDKVICAGYQYGGKDACKGDSGGPLSCSHDGHSNWTVVGVVIWGDGCAQIQRPGVYTNVQHYIPWIAKTIGSTIFSQGSIQIIG